MRVERLQCGAEGFGGCADVRETTGRHEGEHRGSAGSGFGRVLAKDASAGCVGEDLAQEVGAETAARDDDVAFYPQGVDALDEGEHDAFVHGSEDVGAAAGQ